MGAEAFPPNFYHEQARKFVEAVLQVHLHVMCTFMGNEKLRGIPVTPRITNASSNYHFGVNFTFKKGGKQLCPMASWNKIMCFI